MCWKWADSFESSKKMFSSSFPQRSKNVLRSSSVSLKLIPGFHVKLGHFATGWEKQSTPLLFGKKKQKNIYIYKVQHFRGSAWGGKKNKTDRRVAAPAWRRSKINCCFNLSFFVGLFSAIYSIALRLHTIAFQFDWCFFFSLIIIFLRIEKREEKRKKNKVPFLRDDVLFPFFADQIPMPPSYLPYFLFFFNFFGTV